MKLQCQIEVINRQHVTLNIKSSGKYLKSTLALGKEPNCDDFFIIHFSSVNKTGTKYNVKSIKQVFVKCINEGKTTIRLEKPPHDLCIKSETIQLKSFMRLLKSCITGDTKNIQLSSLSNISVTAKDNAPTKLVIHNRSEFPAKGLSRTLQNLHISGLKLCNFRRDILLLRQLVVLDLSNNEIEKIPPEFGRMPSMCELNLSNNRLGTKGDVDWRWLLGPQVNKTLKLLDLSGNKINALPIGIWKLRNLVTLKLDDNRLKYLPLTLGRINTLRYLTTSKNSLSSLPASLMQCRLEYIDVSGNDFNFSEEIPHCNNPLGCHYVGTLVHLSCKAVIKNNIFYAPNIIPWHLVEFLDNACLCACGSPISKFTVNAKYDLKDFFKVVVFDTNRDSNVVFAFSYCSSWCYKMYHRGICYIA